MKPKVSTVWSGRRLSKPIKSRLGIPGAAIHSAPTSKAETFMRQWLLGSLFRSGSA